MAGGLWHGDFNVGGKYTREGEGVHMLYPWYHQKRLNSCLGVFLSSKVSGTACHVHWITNPDTWKHSSESTKCINDKPNVSPINSTPNQWIKGEVGHLHILQPPKRPCSLQPSFSNFTLNKAGQTFTVSLYSSMVRTNAVVLLTFQPKLGQTLHFPPPPPASFPYHTAQAAHCFYYSWA